MIVQTATDKLRRFYDAMSRARSLAQISSPLKPRTTPRSFDGLLADLASFSSLKNSLWLS
eukprot:m.199609 g.199609  ORF g.199609 m.199609 type:complete len:60 (+) comp18392_c7_seq1:612-791(+)